MFALRGFEFTCLEEALPVCPRIPARAHLDNAHLRTSLSYLLRKGKAFLRSLSALVRAIHLATPGAESVAMSPLPISTSRDSDAGLSSAGVGLVERAKPKSPGNCRFDYRQKENMSRPASTSEGGTGKASACPAGRNRSMLARVCASLICYDTGVAWPYVGWTDPDS